MSRDFPAFVDPWRLAESRRSLAGSWPLAKLDRLVPLLAAADSEVEFTLDFAIDEIGNAFVDVGLDAQLTLTCQRTLELYQHPLARKVRLGLIRRESDEATLPEGYEPLLVSADEISTVTIVEDELILAIPLVPKKPEAPLDQTFGPAVQSPGAAQPKRDNPFAVLKELKNKT